VDDAEKARRAFSFGETAATYDRVRPGYPVAAVRWLAEGIPGSAVADVGAGTGKLTRLLVAEGLDVTAVEPEPGMRAVHTGTPVVEGSGEQLPFADGSLDLVTYGQSFHWTTRELAVAEAARVLRPGGSLGLIWNGMDVSVDWVRELDEITGTQHRTHDSDPAQLLPAVPELAPEEEARFSWFHELPEDDLAVLAGTWSWVSTLLDAERSVVLAKVADLARKVSVGGVVRIPEDALCVRARRS
jgi:SAM-dependent methyltransferase